MPSNRTLSLLATCVVGGLAFVAIALWVDEGHDPTPGRLIYAFLFGFAFTFFPFGIMVAGWLKMRDLRREQEAMDDTVKEDPVGEDKLRDWIASKQSLEAQIGLVEQTHDHDKYHALRDVPDDDPRGKPK